MLEKQLRQHIRDNWPEAAVNWLEPSNGIPSGQTDTMIWAGGRWWQCELKAGKKPPPLSMRPSQVRRATLCTLANIPYIVVNLNDAEVIGIWKAIEGRDSTCGFLRVTQLNLEQFNPNNLSKALKSVLSEQ